MKRLKEIAIITGIIGFCTGFWLLMAIALGSALARLAG